MEGKGCRVSWEAVKFNDSQVTTLAFLVFQVWLKANLRKQQELKRNLYIFPFFIKYLNVVKFSLSGPLKFPGEKIQDTSF
jgi:hypothetical protein